MIFFMRCNLELLFGAKHATTRALKHTKRTDKLTKTFWGTSIICHAPAPLLEIFCCDTKLINASSPLWAIHLKCNARMAFIILQFVHETDYAQKRELWRDNKCKPMAQLVESYRNDPWDGCLVNDDIWWNWSTYDGTSLIQSPELKPKPKYRKPKIT